GRAPAHGTDAITRVALVNKSPVGGAANGLSSEALTAPGSRRRLARRGPMERARKRDGTSPRIGGPAATAARRAGGARTGAWRVCSPHASSGTRMHRLKYAWTQRQKAAFRNRQELLRAGLTRRDLFKFGLLSSTGYLATKGGLSAWAGGGCDPGECDLGCSPPTLPFVDPLFIPPVLPERDPLTDP